MIYFVLCLTNYYFRTHFRAISRSNSQSLAATSKTIFGICYTDARNKLACQEMRLDADPMIVVKNNAGTMYYLARSHQKLNAVQSSGEARSNATAAEANFDSIQDRGLADFKFHLLKRNKTDANIILMTLNIRNYRFIYSSD